MFPKMFHKPIQTTLNGHFVRMALDRVSRLTSSGAFAGASPLARRFYFDALRVKPHDEPAPNLLGDWDSLAVFHNSERVHQLRIYPKRG